MNKLILCLLIMTLSLSVAFSQVMQSIGPNSLDRKSEAAALRTAGSAALPSWYKSPKRPGHYTAHDWRHLIDSLWGPGLPTSTKLDIFDSFWGRVDREYAGFPNLNVNWDSIRTKYRPEVQAGVSRGRFAAIMGQLSLALQECHTGIEETGIDTVAGLSVHDVYLPGVPLLWLSGWGVAGNFGATLTPLPDSSLLVCRVVASHPLGLVPGDIVLGYDRVPWKRLMRELLAAELPIQEAFLYSRGSTPRSWTHSLLCCAGKNWGLFDTIDVVKYVTGDTLHLPTAQLAGLKWNSFFASEQLTVPGVPMPDPFTDNGIRWGVVENTTIGYIYALGWQDFMAASIAAAFRDLLTVKKVTGLIIDSRYNSGGMLVFGSTYLDPLFNFSPPGLSRWREARRFDPANHLSFAYYPPSDSAQTLNSDYFDRPIAFLTGPHAWSAGDLTAFKMRFHPMARLFGLPTSGTFPSSVLPVWASDQELARWGTWDYLIEITQMQSLVNNEGFLMHKGFPVDEEVWLTRDGVAKGVDDVVKRAMEWITSLSYAHDVNVSKNAVKKTGDSVVVTATVENPRNHALAVSAIMRDVNGARIDSVVLMNDGKHGDGAAGDSIWGVTIKTPSGDGLLGISVRTDDKTQGTYRHLPNTRVVASEKLIMLAGYGYSTADTVAGPGKTLNYRIILKNTSSSVTVRNVTAKVRSLDSTVIVQAVELPFGDLNAAQSSSGSTTVRVRYSSSRPGNYSVQFLVDISSEGTVYWTDTFSIMVTTVEDRIASVPKVFALEQNFPNPFNPSTTILYDLPKSTRVSLNIYSTLGQLVATLVDERKEAGCYQATWNANVPSGIYFYRLQAGEFGETKKMILLR